MSAIALVVQQAPVFAAGVATSAQATDASNGNVFSNDGRTALRVKNGSGSPVNVVFTLPSSPRNGLGGFGATLTVAVAAGAEKDFGFLDPLTFNNSTGQAQFQVSSSTSVTATVMQYIASPV